MVGPLSVTKGERSMAGVEGLSCGMRVLAETGGSATGLSATDAWHGATVSDDVDVGQIGTVARLSFRQKAQNLDSTNGGNIQKDTKLSRGWNAPKTSRSKVRKTFAKYPSRPHLKFITGTVYWRADD
jgi:hypothetical protein